MRKYLVIFKKSKNKDKNRGGKKIPLSSILLAYPKF